MHTPNGGHRSTQWIIQSQGGPASENRTVTWERVNVVVPIDSPARAQMALQIIRDSAPDYEFRAIRIETVQRVEDW